jgi:hypothetical protein
MFVLHRVFRSRAEFLAAFGNSENIDANQLDGFKLNRLMGWAPQSNSLEEIRFSIDYTKNTRMGLEALSRSEILKPLAKARQKVLARSETNLERYLDLPNKLKLLSNGMTRGLVFLALKAHR